MPDSLALTDLYHVGIVVQDLDVAMQRYSAELGIGPWGTFGGEVSVEFRGSERAISVRAAYARSGTQYIELVEPTTGEWTGSIVLAERGEGAYHLGYWVDDFDAAIQRALALGYTIETSANGFAYLDASRSAGVHIELVSRSFQPFIEDLVSKA